MKKGIKGNKDKKFNVLNSTKIKAMAINKQKSPTLLTNKAFNAALTAGIRVFQKLINKKEHNPTPSQPKNKRAKLSAVTKISIKNVKRERYDKNRGKLGSVNI